MSQRRKGRDRGRGGGGGPPGSLPFFWGAGERGGGPSCLAWRRLQPFWFFIPPPPPFLVLNLDAGLCITKAAPALPQREGPVKGGCGSRGLSLLQAQAWGRAFY